jgi:hypothetical protein
VSGVGRFVDVELLVITWLAGQLPALRFCTELPGDIEGVDIVRVTRSPGSNTDMEANPRIDVEAFSATRAGMWTLIGQVNDAIARIKGQVVIGIQVDCPYTITDPVAAWWSPTVQRAVAVYAIELRVISV